MATAEQGAQSQPVIFATAATRLAGLASILLHWTPDQFWAATPAEFATILAALSDLNAPLAQISPPDAATRARLMEMYPDG
jgi:hypothetical protein